MDRIAICAARALTPHDEITNAALLIEDGVITAVARRAAISLSAGTREVDAGDCIAVPGFVDIHIHGAGGFDVMDTTPEAMAAVARTVACFGTTSLVATTVTASPDQTCRSVEGIARGIRGQRTGTAKASPAAEYLGIHFEGPFISHARRGVHPAEWIAPPSEEMFRRILDASGGCARILTLAPEAPNALQLITLARNAGLVVGMGHTDATYEETQAAIARGATHAVHVFNAMRPFSHRQTGVLGAVLTEPRVTCELIADGVHVDDAAIRLLLAAKGAAGTILISDATAATAMPDGKYRLGTFEVSVSGGVCRDAQGHLAGSTLTLDRALRKIVALGVELKDAVRMLTHNPALLLGLEKTKGALAPGADADIVLLDKSLSVHKVFVRGRMIEPS